MKKTFFVLTFATLSFVSLFGQNIIKGSVIASNREDLLHKLPTEIAYVIPEFTKSQILYKSGNRFEAVLNICQVDNTVRYIDDKGDTLIMANIEDVSKIFAGNRLYQQINGNVLHQLVAYGKISVSEKTVFNISEPEINIGFTNIAPTSTARSYNPSKDDMAKDYGKDMEVPYSLEISYVFTDGNKIYPCKQSTFIKFFPEKKAQIKAFVKDNKIDFSNKEHVLSLFYMCTE